MWKMSVVVTWWFIVIVPGFQGLPVLTMVGPFAVEMQCEKYWNWVQTQIPHNYLSDCWDDETA